MRPSFMHVGVICEHSDPGRGGAERYLRALAARFRARGHRVTVCARTGPEARPVRGWPPALRPGYYAREFLPFLRDEGAERVLATVPVPGCDFYQPHNGLLSVCIPAHLDPVPAPWRHLRRANPVRGIHFAVLRGFEDRCYRPPAKVLALSPRVVEDLAGLYPDARSVLTRPGVDLGRFAPGGARDGPDMLFVAHNFRLKGLATVLRALDRLPDRRLLVVGRDRPVPHPRAEYRSDDADLPALFRSARVVVHPTWYDTASLVVLEALASGTPVITSMRDGNADLAVEGGGAAVNDPGDDEALARAIEAVAASADPGRARAVAERYGEQAMLDRVVEVVCGSAS